jgi:ornithine cyclodeaminase
MGGVRRIGPEDVVGRLTWRAVADAIEAGHRLPRARLGDQLLRRDPDALLSRAAWIDGLGIGVKSVTVMPGNRARGEKTIDGAMLFFDDRTGRLLAVLDSDLVTAWKTAGDSVLGARLLARPDSRRLLILGAGTVAASLVRAYGEIFAGLDEILIWNRTGARAEELARALAAEGYPVRATPDRAEAAAVADIIAAATMSQDPVLEGAWVRPGTHVDLIGAFTPAMREADDQLISAASLFVDCRETTIEHIGELMLPLASGVIRREDVLGDLYNLVAGEAGRRAPEDITVFKNGGGAHLDLMTAGLILERIG